MCLDFICYCFSVNRVLSFLTSVIVQGFAVTKEEQDKVAKFSFHGQPAELKHGSVVIAAITSCTNTSNPSVMLGAGLVAKKACELGLQVRECSVVLCILDSLTPCILLSIMKLRISSPLMFNLAWTILFAFF